MTVPTPATGIWFFPDRPAGELVEAIVHAERCGLDEVWLGDEGPAREPFAVLAAAATRTRRIRLALGVTNPYVRHPGVAVAAAATIAELAGGRVTLGVGAGGAMSLGPFGLDVDSPIGSVRDFVAIARASRSGRAVDGYLPSDLAVAPVAPEVPIFLGARGPRLNRLASEVADGAFVAGMPPFRFAEVAEWARSVRPIDIAVYPSVALDDAARERHRPEMI
jgi:5,10-methylenetetrahydromethanopterin reductase